MREDHIDIACVTEDVGLATFTVDTFRGVELQYHDGTRAFLLNFVLPAFEKTEASYLEASKLLCAVLESYKVINWQDVAERAIYFWKDQEPK